ncbi:MAG: hypothetical protein DNFNHJIP_00011 [Candidatus Argoarchaeum ethanivorans]|uniref:O-antigen ligase domain-containing protein n=1 Tax=Candidatus Argoarchaeum ethanivorans TaxID=2608793 RepID=A0A812A207_9EURY|nr:MAG: hypothetical protein DNFNHJIP_00011 [Candidatus Argoarchaeum ethanivorans]
MTLGQRIELGLYTFNVIRILVAIGVIRVILRRERIAGGFNAMDMLIVVWSMWALISSVFHKDPSVAITFRLGLVYNTCGIYFLFRVFCQSLEDLIILCRILAVVLLPVAVEMINEKIMASNYFSVLGGVPEFPKIREGKLRAQGPFAHAIMAGTVGALSLPLVIALWHQHRREAIIGIFSCLAIIVTCASSGPILSALAGIGALYLWKFREWISFLRWIGLLGYIGLDLVMKDPAYYIMARIDITGGSTGWHRAKLINMALKHIDEWWLGGTDFTRHWMPTGVSWSPDHSDITNHYIKMGVIGGLPLMLLFIAIVLKGFSFVGQTLHQVNKMPFESQFMIWALGASLFSIAATCISVSFFDQSFLFLYLVLAMISSMRNVCGATLSL